jgi:outer membrane protein assembly factor BamA
LFAYLKIFAQYKNAVLLFKKTGYCILLLLPICSKAQQTPAVVDSSVMVFIKDVVVKGNKKTKEYLILREIPFKKGDSLTLTDLQAALLQGRQLVYNTTLFNEVNIQLAMIGSNAALVIVDVKERWYIYPVPQFKPIDRNLNEWLKTYKGSLDRVNYGLKFVHYNLSGRRDQLRVFFLSGFSRDFSFSYNAPYSNKKLTEGFIVNAGYSQKKQIAYNSSYSGNLQFYSFDSLRTKFVGSTFTIGAGYTSRKGYYNRNTYNISFTRFVVSDSIVLAKNNPNYLGNGNTAANVIELLYTYQHVNVDNVLYALKGVTSFVSLSKRGLGFTGGINALTVEGGINKFIPLGKNWYSSFFGNTKIRLPFNQPYINQRGLGYGESYLRGLEYLVVDGVATALLRSTLKKKILEVKIPVPFKIKALPYIPFTIFAKTYADVGFAYNKKQYLQNLNNRLLYTGGFGLDILSVYDVNLRLEYSFNQLGQKGLFLHTQTGF